MPNSLSAFRGAASLWRSKRLHVPSIFGGNNRNLATRAAFFRSSLFADMKPQGSPRNKSCRFLASNSNIPSRKQRKQKGNANNDNLTKEDKEAALIEEKTLAWVERVVVGMNLCPFAAKPMADQQVYVVVVRGDDLKEIMGNVLAQAEVFTEEKLPGTALVVCPELHPNDFNSYLDVVNMMTEGLLEDFDLTGKIQIVPFHPQFVFAEEDEDDKEDIDEDIEDDIEDSFQSNQRNADKMEYWTNRSPYPMFHILNENDVTRAVDLMKGDTDRVWKRNVHLLQHLEETTVADADTPGEGAELQTSRRTLLESYLLSGRDESQGIMKSIIHQALTETAREFPTLARPVRDEKDTSEDE